MTCEDILRYLEYLAGCIGVEPIKPVFGELAPPGGQPILVAFEI